MKRLNTLQRNDTVLRMTSNAELRKRLQKKLAEYRRRIRHYVAKNSVQGYGVFLDKDNRLLDAHYKERLFSEVLQDGTVNTGLVRRQLKDDFQGHMDNRLFNNAVRVLEDYIRTGGSNTSGGSGFMDKKLFHKLIADEERIVLPRDAKINRRLRRKYHEYLGRLVDYERHPDRQVTAGSLVRDEYKAMIIERLRDQGMVDVHGLARQMENQESEQFHYRQFLRAASVVKNFCERRDATITDYTG